MADVLRTTTDPILGRIRLAWWRERLEGLDNGDVPAEPRLQAVAAELRPRGVSGAELSTLENGWAPMFDPFPWNVDVIDAVAFRGRLLFRLAARLLGGPSDDIEAAGGLWSAVDVARHCSDAASRSALVACACKLGRGIEGARFPTALRALSMLTALAWVDAQHGKAMRAEGSPQRALAMMMHRLTGKL